MNFIIKIIIRTLAILVTSYFFPKHMVAVDGISTAIVLSLVIAFLNAIVRPIMMLLTLPITIFTFGLFVLVINASIIMIADHFIDGFKVNGFWSAFIFALILALVNSIFELIRRNDNNRGYN